MSFYSRIQQRDLQATEFKLGTLSIRYRSNQGSVTSWTAYNWFGLILFNLHNYWCRHLLFTYALVSPGRNKQVDWRTRIKGCSWAAMHSQALMGLFHDIWIIVDRMAPIPCVERKRSVWSMRQLLNMKGIVTWFLIRFEQGVIWSVPGHTSSTATAWEALTPKFQEVGCHRFVWCTLYIPKHVK